MFFETLVLTMVGLAGISEGEQKVASMEDFDDLQGKWFSNALRSDAMRGRSAGVRGCCSTACSPGVKWHSGSRPRAWEPVYQVSGLCAPGSRGIKS